MIEVITGLKVWPRLHDAYLTGDERKHAAIAYIGSRANDWLNLRPGDTLVFDGDDRSVRANHIDLDVIGNMMDLKVVLYSRSGLHAKVMVVEGAKPLAMVGSANASITSVEKKVEAVMVTDQRTAVDELRLVITTWQAGLEPLKPDWLARARDLPRDQSTAPSEYELVDRVKIDADKPMWLIDWVWTDKDYSTEAIDTADAEGEQLGLAVVPFPLGRQRKLFDAITPNEDSVLFIPWAVNGRRPHSAMRVDEPGLVVGKIERGRYILVAYSYDASDASWAEVRDALRDSDIEGDQLGAHGKQAVIKLFSRE